MVEALNSGILICAAAVSSAVELVNYKEQSAYNQVRKRRLRTEAEGADFLAPVMLNDRFTEQKTLSAALGVDEPLAPSGPRGVEEG